MTTIHEFCESNENAYVKAFSAEVDSQRCCDEKKCVCVCDFRCNTFDTKEEEFRTEGYKHCIRKANKFHQSPSAVPTAI